MGSPTCPTCGSDVRCVRMLPRCSAGNYDPWHATPTPPGAAPDAASGPVVPPSIPAPAATSDLDTVGDGGTPMRVQHERLKPVNAPAPADEAVVGTASADLARAEARLARAEALLREAGPWLRALDPLGTQPLVARIDAHLDGGA